MFSIGESRRAQASIGINRSQCLLFVCVVFCLFFAFFEAIANTPQIFTFPCSDDNSNFCSSQVESFLLKMQQVSKAEFRQRLQAAKSGTYESSSALGASSSSGAAAAAQSSVHREAPQNPFNWKTTTVRDQRGAAGISNVKPPKNVADNTSQLSLPVAPGPNRPEKVARTSCDVVKHCQLNVLLTGETIFTKAACSTSKGWSKGKMV